MQKKGLLSVSICYLLAFAATGAFVVYDSKISPVQQDSEAHRWLEVMFIIHIPLWMLGGMTANYLWDLFRNGKSFNDILLRDLFIPVLVSPIVFYGIYTLFLEKAINFTMVFIAFQNGFFWQVIFSK